MRRPLCRTRWLGLLLALGLLASSAAGCHHDDGAVLLVVVTAAGSPTAVASLNVMIMGPAGNYSQSYAPAGMQSISFPTTLSAELPARALGSLSLYVTAEDASGG